MRPAKAVVHEAQGRQARFTPHVADNTSDELTRLRQENARYRRDRALAEERIAELEQRLAALEDFTAMAAHELLKPLILAEATATAILERTASRLDLLSQDDLRRMTRASGRVRLMVEGLLADARPGAALKRERVDLAAVVHDCLELLKPEIDAKRARIVVEPMPIVMGNQALLNGAVGNLLANALKYGSRANTEIRIGIAHKDDGWLFSVDSQGRAIPPRDRTVIFDAWRRGQDERRAKGAGLGLAIVRRIVERHGGEVGVVPLNSRSGNRFFFTLPV